MFDRHNTVVAAVATVLLTAIVFITVAWAGVRATEADREFRSRKAEACRTIEDDSIRALCITGGDN